jgi:hypothetical protein
MQIFDLLFIILFLSSVVAIVLALVAAARGDRSRARTIVRGSVVVLVAYVVVVGIVGLASPQHVISLGTDQCSDDWCIVADSVHREADRGGTAYTVGLRLSSRARRVAQRERFVVVYLRDADGRRFDPVPDAAAVPFDTLLQAGETIRAVRRFVVPTGARVVGLVVAREGGLRFPGCCIIGDEGSFLHKRTMVRID